MAQKTWTVKSALEWTAGYLERKGDEHPRLSAEWLLCDVTGFSRVEVYMNYDRPLDAAELDRLHVAVERRGRGEPLQYITGEMPFRHIVLKCAPGVLIPRPETEVLVDCVLEYLDGRGFGEVPARGGARGGAKDVAADDAADATGETSDSTAQKTARILDVGTGTGCIALSIAGERACTHVVATDISPVAIELATRNRDALNLAERVDIVQGDLTDGVEGARGGAFDVLVSNPPYIPTELCDHLPDEVGSFEPRLALDGGADGLDVFRRLIRRAADALAEGGLFACELHEECLVAASKEPELVAVFDNIRIVRDLTGRNRILLALRGPRVADQDGGVGEACADSTSDASVPSGTPVPAAAPAPAVPVAERFAGHVARVDVSDPDADVVVCVAAVLRAGAAVVMPTDTVYGVGQSVLANPQGAELLYRLKGRDRNKPIAWLVADADDLGRYGADVPQYAFDLAREYWPGGLTLVVKAAPEVPEPYLGADGTVALRVPDAPLVRSLVRAAGSPLAVTSANVSGCPAATCIDELDGVAFAQTLILDGGPAAIGAASTIVDCTGPEPRVLREGPLKVVRP